ncbi:MAG: hypothetical protein A2V91_03750 [Candidatus Muproteobacteria bacterium RBG_16_64_10]|uniref:YtxH domain-containing protein n=1 Tax=Candidatus Muproteobacteria bacterium RBG_16_64_10 TaxID=1817757 RepID=A0A1F6SXU4_9PROT|nr:MAG: hypothetical protein A2V91_03750 [Candidatus Muproteobacteria bacterium RBG_16_64_10]
MKKFLAGFLIGAILAFPLGINFGRDAPLLSNPLEAKPDIPDKVLERTGELVEGAKEALHEATKPIGDKLKK